MKDLSQAIPDAAAFDAAVIVGLRRAVDHAVTIGVKKARGEHAWQDRTYATRESLRGAVRDTARGASGTFGPADTKGGENAARLATGTRPHEIRPKLGADLQGPTRPGQGRSRRGTGRKFLAFQIGGTTIFARKVNHPGTKPDPYLDAAAEAAGEELFAAVDEVLDRAFG
jgi:hypothetical protein